MNKEKSISGWLFVYTLFIIVLIVSPFIPIISFFTSTSIILIPLFIVSLIFIYTKSKYARVLNIVTLFLTTALEISVIYFLLKSNSEAPKFILDFIVVAKSAIALASSLFFVYWIKSRQVKDFFSVSSPINTQIPGTTLTPNVNQSNSVPINTSNNLSQGYKAILIVISLISCGMFIFSGWGAFFFTPIALFFSILYSIIFSKILKGNNTSFFSVLTVTLTLVFAYISILFNIGVITDSDHPSFLAAMILGIPDSSFVDIFGKLLSVSLLYFLVSIPVNFALIKRNSKKVLLASVPLFGLILILIHWAIVFQKMPELKAQVQEEKQHELQQEQARIEGQYKFDWLKISNDTFRDRIYSIFTPPTPAHITSADQCDFTMNMIEQNIKQETFDVVCLNDSLKSIGQMPITQTNVLSVSMPNSTGLYKKGDVVAVVAELDNPSMMRIYANGNAAKNCACNMSPYDYSGITSKLTVGTSTVIYEQSVIQMSVNDKKRTVMILYPININGLKEINIKLSQFSDRPNVPVTLKEVAVLSQTKQSPDPEWLKKWSREPNPFLNKQ